MKFVLRYLVSQSADLEVEAADVTDALRKAHLGGYISEALNIVGASPDDVVEIQVAVDNADGSAATDEYIEIL